MSESLKCVFCGAELVQVPNCLMFCCRNKTCAVSRDCLPLIVWQALIDGKKAQDALSKFKEKAIDVEVVNGCEGRSLYMDNYRVAGSKPWGGGTCLETWHIRGEDIIKAFPELKIASITKQANS